MSARMGTWKRVGMVLAVVATMAGALSAQNQEPAKPADAGTQQPMATAPVIRTESRIVLVDTVVTDKKGHYISDLKKEDFKVFEDNKEQSVSSFSFGADPAVQQAGQRHYMILFFDTTSMEMGDQAQARQAASKFIDSNTGQDRLIAVVNFGGTLVIRQNFTTNAGLLKTAVENINVPHIDTSGQTQASTQPVGVPMSGMPAISSVEQDFGARTMLLSIRSLAKNLRGVPGRKMLILFTAGFPLTSENMSELTATIDACNKANVAIYPLDVRGLMAPMMGGGAPGSARNDDGANASGTRTAAVHDGAQQIRPRLILSSYLEAALDAEPPQHTGGGGGGTGGGGTGGGGTGGGGGHGGTGGTGGTGGSGGGKGGSGGTGGTGGGARGGGGTAPAPVGSAYGSYYNNPMNRPQVLLPQIPPSVTTNQQVMQMLADGTGGFTIYNTNDLLGGLQRIANEMDQFYVLGYVPAESEEGTCHTLKVKMNRNGLEVRSRSGYCNVRPTNPLDGKPIEKQMEAQAGGTAQGTIHASMEAPYFYAAPNIARVNLSMEIPGDSLIFNKDKGKYHANVNVLGVAYKPDGSVGARFNDVLNLEMDKDEWKEFTKQPYRYQNQFDAAPGTYKLSVVLSSGGEGFAKMEKQLQIDAYDGNKFVLGGVVLSSNLQPVDQIPTEVDATLLEDRKPLIVKGMQITPAASYQFKKDDNVVLYSELYEPALKSDPATKVVTGYRIFDASQKEVLFTGGIPLDGFVEKGNPVVPFALKVQTKDLAPGSYKLVLLAVDGKNNQAPQRPVDFAISN